MLSTMGQRGENMNHNCGYLDLELWPFEHVNSDFGHVFMSS